MSVAKLKPRMMQLVPPMNITLEKVSSMEAKLLLGTHSPPKSKLEASVRQDASHVLERCTSRRDAKITRNPTRQIGRLRKTVEFLSNLIKKLSIQTYIPISS